MSQDSTTADFNHPLDLVSSLKSLEASFEGVEKKLDRIEFEVDQRINDANKGHLLTGESVSDFLKQFQVIKSDHATLVKEMAELQLSQESAVKEVLSQLQETANVVTTFKEKFGEPVAESDNERNAESH